MGINDLQIYQMAMTLGEQVWSIVHTWEQFAKNTIGSQVVRSADSVAANISEGFGRYHYKENMRFCYIARGSLLETRTWFDKANRRGLINEVTFAQVERDINNLGVKLNNYIKSIGVKANAAGNQVSEPPISYGSQTDSGWETMTDSEANDNE